MGRSDISTVSIGISIQIKDVLDAMHANNYQNIRNTIFTEYAFIEDENGYYNNTYLGILGGNPPRGEEIKNANELPYEEYKEYLCYLFKKYGNACGCRHGDEYKYEEDDLENLYHSILLVPHYSLVKTERFGYNRDGCNGSSSILNISELMKLEKEIHEKMTSLKIDKDKYDVSLVLLQCVW
jgi:hypothetical protein